MWDKVARALEIAELDTMYERPSPAAMRGNAVLIDLAGGCRAIDVPKPWPPIVRVPVPRSGEMRWTEFELSSVLDGRAVYHQRR